MAIVQRKKSTSTNSFNQDNNFTGSEYENGSIKFPLSKFDYELFDETKNTVQVMYRVKRKSLPNKGENWKIYENEEVVFTLEGEKLSNKEKEFLRSVEGVSFLMSEAKKGIKSFHQLKLSMKPLIAKKK